MNIFKNLFHGISSLGLLWQKKQILTLLRWNVLFILVQIGLLVLEFNHLPSQVPLFYSLSWGQSRLAPASSLFLLPTFSLVILLLNYFVAAFFVNSTLLFCYLPPVFSLLFSIFSLIDIYRIINILS